MSAVKPPEWDTMSANEQSLWYLKRLCAKAEEMSSLLGVASAGDPPVVTPLVDSAASTTTHASSGPALDASGSTTKAQEVLEVIHDASLACIAMVPVICSTKCSTQVETIDSVDEIHDAALDTIVHVTKGLEPDPDEANAELTHTVTPTEIFPELVSLEVCGAGHGVVTIDVNIPTASVFTGSSVWPNSNFGTPESSLPSTHKDAQLVFEPMPRLFDNPEYVAADVKEHKDDAKLSLVFEEHMRSELVCTLSLFPWNPGGYLLKHSNQMTRVFITANRGSQWHVTCVMEESSQCMFRPRPWPSFDCLQAGVHLKYAGPPLQVTYVMKHFSGDLNFPRESWSCLPIVQQKSCQSAQVVCWIPMVPGEIPIPSQPIVQFIGDLYLGVVEGWPTICFVQSSCKFRAQNAQQMFRFSQKNAHLKLRRPSCSYNCRALQLRSALPIGEIPPDYYASVTNFDPAVTISIDGIGSLQNVDQQFLVVHEQVRQLAGHFCRGKWWSTKDLVYTIQEWTSYKNHVLEHATVGNIPSPEKLQKTMKTLNMLVWWQPGSQGKIKWSGHASISSNIGNSDCSNEQFGDLHQTHLVIVICEAMEEVALISMTSWISTVVWLPKMQSYLKNRNP